MKKLIVGLVGVALASVLMAGVAAGGNDIVFPDDNGLCPDGFTLGYSEELGEFCEVLGAEIVATDDPTDDAAGAALARTGSDSSIPLARIAIILVAVGGVLILGTRARRHTTSEA